MRVVTMVGGHGKGAFPSIVTPEDRDMHMHSIEAPGFHPVQLPVLHCSPCTAPL